MRAGAHAWCGAITSALVCACGASQPSSDSEAPRARPVASASIQDDACSGSHFGAAELAELPAQFRPGMPAAEYRARARSVFGSGALEDSHWIFAFNRCFAASFSVANERLSDFWLEAGTSDDEALDDASYQAYRDTTRAIIDALRARYGEPTRTSQGPDQLPPVEQLVGKAAPAPLCAAWHENGVAFAVSLAVDVGKGVRDLRLRFQVKAPEREWAWQAC